MKILDMAYDCNPEMCIKGSLLGGVGVGSILRHKSSTAQLQKTK